MIVHNFKWKDYEFTRNPGEDFYNRILFQKVDLKPVKTEVNKIKPAFNHWVISWYTLLRERLINIEWVIIAESEQIRDELIKKLDNLFLPAIDFNINNTWIDKFYFEDPNWNKFYIECKPIEAVEYNEEQWERNLIFYKTTLLADNPFIYWVDLISISDVNRTQWTTLDTELETNLGYNSWTTINYQWAITTPLNAKITAITDDATDWYVRFRNLTTWKLFRVAVNMNTDDVLEIDTKNKVVYLNWTDISASIDIDSEWIYLINWNNDIVVDTWTDYHTVDVEYTYQNLWI